MNSCMLIEIIRDRVLIDKYKNGLITADLDISELKKIIGNDFVYDEEWEELYQIVSNWHDIDSQKEKNIMDVIFDRFYRFPTIERVTTVLGEHKGEIYKIALETIESNDIIINLSAYPWRKFDMDTAANVIIDVISPNIGNDVSMRMAFNRLVSEIKARRREKTRLLACNSMEKKKVVKDMGIWFPISKDIDRWKSDPRTKDLMPDFITLMDSVIKRMRIVRSYLQHIPRRRISNKACQDIRNNMERMKKYLNGYNS
jgi:hypothetical protein